MKCMHNFSLWERDVVWNFFLGGGKHLLLDSIVSPHQGLKDNIILSSSTQRWV